MYSWATVLFSLLITVTGIARADAFLVNSVDRPVGASMMERVTQLAQAPLSACEIGGIPVKTGYIHRWCPGTPGPLGSCSVSCLCKTCNGTSGWSSPSRCTCLDPSPNR